MTLHRWAVAVHEASHAVTALGFGLPLKAATVVRHGRDAGSVTLATASKSAAREVAAAGSSPRVLELVYLFDCIWSRAGGVGEEAMGLDTGGCTPDHVHAIDALDRLWDVSGCPPWRLDFLLDQTLRGYLRQRAVADALLRIASRLYDRSVLTGAELSALAGPLPRLDLSELQRVVQYWSRAPAPAPAPA